MKFADYNGLSLGAKDLIFRTYLGTYEDGLTKKVWYRWLTEDFIENWESLRGPRIKIQPKIKENRIMKDELRKMDADEQKWRDMDLLRGALGLQLKNRSEAELEAVGKFLSSQRPKDKPEEDLSGVKAGVEDKIVNYGILKGKMHTAIDSMHRDDLLSLLSMIEDKQKEPITAEEPGAPNKRHGHPMFYEILEGLADLHSRKNHDYASGGDPLGNFKRRATFYAMYPGLDLSDPTVIALVDSMKQLDAALWFLSNKHTPMVEGKSDRLRDVAVYAVIAMVLELEKEKEAHS